MQLRRLWFVAALIGAMAFGPTLTSAEEARDNEERAHGDAAASYQWVDTYEFPGLKIVQYDLAVLSHFSYMLFSGGECLIVDPGRDIETYLEAAQKENAKIVGVWLTHSHADFVAGHIEFARRLEVPLRISHAANADYEHVSLKENDTLTVGAAVIRFLETPGHTPDSMCGIVANAAAPDKPLALLTGDTLFVGSVGRPDLLGEGMAASTLASMMFDTWTKKLSELPDDVLVMPAHGAGSLCGAHLSDDPVSTIGRERTSNNYLQYKNRGEFVAAILEGLPEAPQYFAHNAAMNREGPELVNWNPEALPLVAPSEDLIDPRKYYVVDVRSAREYAEGHIPNSVNIAVRGRFETWTGIMVPWESQVVLSGSEQEMREALFRLNRVGYRAQCIPFESWLQSGLPTSKNEMIAPRQLYDKMQTSEAPIVVDVRLPAEWIAVRIGTVLNIPLTKLSEEAVKLDKSQRIVAVCNSAYRSSLAVGLLERQGFDHASSMAGGGEAWLEAGLPVYEATSTNSGPAVAKRQVRLADRMAPADLTQLLLDLPGTFQLVDIRPPDQFADYHLPSAENVDIAEVLESQAYLAGVGPLILVDRDGTLAMMVAGILSQKTARPVKALSGGLQGYWNATNLGCAVGSSSIGGSSIGGSSMQASPTAPATNSRSQPATPTRPKRRRSAGC